MSERAVQAERAALAAVVLLALVFSVFRVQPVDVPWHLATGRLIAESGGFPTTNTFSWTHPDHTLYQQYPLFQVMLYGTWKVGGFAGLSLLNAGLWMAAMGLWARWAGGLDQLSSLAPFALLAVMGVQRHLLLRPDVMSMILLAALLLAIDKLREEDSWKWVGAIFCIHVLWANSHQLFFMGLAVQGLHLGGWLTWSVLGRAGFEEDYALPVRKSVAALAASLVASMCTPLGPTSLMTPLMSVLTVLTQGAGSSGGAHASELAPVSSDPIASFVFVTMGLVCLAGLGLQRGSWRFFELALLGMGVAFTLVAVRGIGFFAVIAFGVYARTHMRLPYLEPTILVRSVAAAGVIVVSLLFAGTRPMADYSYTGIQFGVGRSVGDWSDGTVTFLGRSAPPGRMLNLDWFNANALMWSYPGLGVFCDPRFESYPKQHLLDCVDAESSATKLATLLDTWKPNWIVAGTRKPEVVERAAELVRSGDWVPVHLDSEQVVLVRVGPETEHYLEGQPATLAELTVGDWLPEHPVLHAQQKVRVAAVYRAFGDEATAEQLLAGLGEAGEHPAVVADRVRFGI